MTRASGGLILARRSLVAARIRPYACAQMRRILDVRADSEAFRRLPLEVHAFLRDVPLHDVSAVDLPGGPPDASLADVRALGTENLLVSAGTLTRLLFGLRFFLGKVFRWDPPGPGPDPAPTSYVHRLSPEIRQRSLVPPGTRDGQFRFVYALVHEALSEIINATAHAFLCSALVPIDGGYRLYWAIYVKPVSRWTRLYMALIDPFRRYIVYPSLLGHVRRAWIRSRERDSNPDERTGLVADLGSEQRRGPPRP